MVRNEYRRAFIMLRAAMPGFGGHVRLERRTLTGSMYFIVTAPQGAGELSAALAGQQNGVYYATPIGALSRDRRGQLSLAWQFDPRRIDGRPLEAYPWVVVADTGDPCAVALTGNVEGSHALNPDALSRAVCALFAPEPSPAADLPEADAPPEAAPKPPFAADIPDADAPRETATISEPEDDTPAPPDPIADGDEMQGDVRIYTRIRSRPRPSQRRKPQPAQAGEDASAPVDAPEAVPVPERAVETIEAVPNCGVSEDAAPSAEADAPATEGPVAAARLLGLDITAPWPAADESLRRLFATQVPASAAPEDGFVYVSAPMPDGSGYGDFLAGLKAENGVVTGIRYALPARRTPEPPPGLEGYIWLPADGDEGYWVTEGDKP